MENGKLGHADRRSILESALDIYPFLLNGEGKHGMRWIVHAAHAVGRKVTTDSDV